MNWKDKIDAFNKRWNVLPEADETYVFIAFKTRMINIFRDIDSHVYTTDVRAFCKIFSIDYAEDHRRGYIINALNSAHDLITIYKMLEIIFAFEIYDNERYVTEHKGKGWYFRETEEAFALSNIQARIVLTGQKEIIIAPAGEEKLDKELVNYALSFLHKNSNQHFVAALKFYDKRDWIHCAENIRRSVEEYLREKLKNNAGLEANISTVGGVLKNQKSPAQIRSIISITLGHLDKFFNEHSKHNDGDFEEADAEFLIYQTGLLMRYLEKYV
ncbi:MAG: hypothetical protein Q8P07_01465 [bacterium]|nr:hypothetical protein [bacterium]